MKAKIFAVILMAIILVSVSVNTFVIDKQISNLAKEVEAIEINEGDTESAYDKSIKVLEGYKKNETYISLSVNHDDLTNIEDTFSEMLGNLSIGDAGGAEVAKNRLLCALMHLRRLSGINIDAII